MTCPDQQTWMYENSSTRVRLEEAYILTEILPGCTFEGIVGAVNYLNQNYPTEARLWVLPSYIDIPSSKMNDLANFADAMSSPGKLALVAESDEAFGLARMHVVYRTHGKIKVFRSLDAASEWMLSDFED